MSIESNVDIISSNYKIITNKEYKYDLFVSDGMMNILGVKSKKNIKKMIKQIDAGTFELPDRSSWFEADGEGHVEINGTKYGYNTCVTLSRYYNSFSTKYDKSIKELKERVKGLKKYATTAKSCFTNANVDLDLAKKKANKLIFKDEKKVKKLVNKCINSCDSTIKKMSYIENNL